MAEPSTTRCCLFAAVLSAFLRPLGASRPEHMLDWSLLVDSESPTLRESMKLASHSTAQAVLASVCTARAPAHDVAALVLLPFLGLGAYAAVSFAEGLWQCGRPQKPDVEDARAVLVDAYRGHLLAAVIIFHFAWDLQWARLELMVDTGSSYWKEFGSFLALGLLGHLAFLAVAPSSSLAGALVYAAGVWYSVTRLKTVSQIYGVRLFCFCSGLVSAMSHERVGFLGRFCMRLGRIGSSAAAISAVSFAVWGRRGAVTFGVLHMLFVCSLLHLPFLALPRPVTAFVAALLTGAGALGVAPEPEAALVMDDALDYEPVLVNLAFVLWGVVAQDLGVHLVEDVPNPLRVLVKRAPSWSCRAPVGLGPFFARLGQWSLPIFLCHQLVLFPAVQGLSRLCIDARVGRQMS